VWEGTGEGHRILTAQYREVGQVMLEEVRGDGGKHSLQSATVGDLDLVVGRIGELRARVMRGQAIRKRDEQSGQLARS
jgi:hypothetical protein